MNYKLLVGVLVIPYAVAAFITGILYLNPSLAANPEKSTSAVADFINVAGNPSEIQINNPAVGSTANSIATDISYPSVGKGWLISLAQSATLTGPIWQGWAQAIRFFIMLFAAPAAFMLGAWLLSASFNFVSAIGGRSTA